MPREGLKKICSEELIAAEVIQIGHIEVQKAKPITKVNFQF